MGAARRHGYGAGVAGVVTDRQRRNYSAVTPATELCTATPEISWLQLRNTRKPLGRSKKHQAAFLPRAVLTEWYCTRALAGGAELLRICLGHCQLRCLIVRRSLTLRNATLTMDTTQPRRA